MPIPTDLDGRLVLIVAPFGRDAASIAQVLAAAPCTPRACSNVDEALGLLGPGTGALVLTEEALEGAAHGVLARALDAQEAWSDVPVVLLLASRSRTAMRVGAAYEFPNVVEVQRPLGASVLLSAVASALRSRQKQFVIRDHAEALERTVAERTRALEAQMAERAAAETALHQARKMESVGQLTGGIAHDFNNMLTGIISGLDLIRMRVEMGRLEGLERYIDVASASAHRATALTQRLLAFSRRQSLNAQRLDLNALVRSLDDLLQRTLGENIVLSTALADDLPTVCVDANQLESAVLNLTINARDAMPNGGRLCLRSHRLELAEAHTDVQGEAIRAGCYAVLSVADTGEGIPADVMEKIFEPFFTTKPIGQGTGLGMSMVYGFMQQSDGHVRIESTVGQGTTVSLYLPEAADEGTPVETTTAAASPTPGGAGQHLLVVEDDDQVRLLVTEVLDELGYTTRVVGDADEALRVLEGGWPVEALITDVGLPGINGRQLAEMTRERHPELPVLFMTGYAQAAQDQSAFLEQGMQLIGKPFSLKDFAEAVARLLPPRG